jgi:hypothetical protein
VRFAPKKKEKQMPRCAICDYTQEEGSELTNRAPDIHVGIRLTDHGEFLCDECPAAIEENGEDLAANDVDEDEV